MEESILSHLKINLYIHLSNQLSKITNIELHYNRENYEDEFKRFTEKISNFMAFQEALFNLMTKGKIMPVNISTIISGRRTYVRVSYSERQGTSTFSGDTDISIPILVHETFMLKPTLKSNL